MTDNAELIDRVIDALLEALKAKLVTATLTVGEVVNLSQPKPQDDQLLTVEQAAERLALSKSWVHKNWKLIPGATRAGKQIRLPAAGIRKYLAQNRGKQ